MAPKKWHKLAALDELAEGRVKSAPCGNLTICLTHFQGQYAALDNRCPHQGGPLGEGSIEKGLLRCPWHGWDFDPLTGKSPDGYGDGLTTYEVESRDDGIYVAVPDDAARERTAADVMAETMVAWGVDSVFGMVGHSNLGLAEAFRVQEDKLRYIGIRHEGAAAFAASAYGKLTGRPAACFAIAGPGATNLLTGLWDANVGGAPVLAITGQVPSRLLGRGAFQEVDLVAAYGQVAGWSTQMSATSDHAELMSLACKNAIVRRCVSHVVVPDEVQVIASPGKKAGVPRGRLAQTAIAPAASAMVEASDMLRAAKRPVIVVGHGARFSMEAITKLGERLRCPVVTTFKAKGLIADDHENACGVLGRSGTPIASWFMNESDLLLVLGASFSNHTGITPKKPTIQVDFDAMRLGRFFAVDVPVWGEISVTVGLLLEQLGDAQAIDQRTEIAERWQLWRAEKQKRLKEETGQGISSAAIFAAMTRQVARDAIITVDVGNNAYSFGRYFECSAQSIIMSGYLGSIGFAFPAALGAWAATQGDDQRVRGRPVVSVSGDGGFAQYMAEMTTAVKYDMNLTHVLLNNAELGKISKEQRAGSWPVWQTDLVNPSFAAFAEQCGAQGILVSTTDQLDDALAKAFAHEGPSLVEITADPSLL